MWRCTSCLCPAISDEVRSETSLHRADVFFRSSGYAVWVPCSSSWGGFSSLDQCAVIEAGKYYIYLRSPWIYWSET